MARRLQKNARHLQPVRTARDLIQEAKKQIPLISCEEAHLRLERKTALVLIDVREEYEYEMVRLGGSIHICRGMLEMVVEEQYPDRDTPMILYCGAGDRSALAAYTLKHMGYRRVASLEGGLHAWQEKELPVMVPAEQRGPGAGI